jgi:DNA-binding beta-propeller fold protein YncE
MGMPEMTLPTYRTALYVITLLLAACSTPDGSTSGVANQVVTAASSNHSFDTSNAGVVYIANEFGNTVSVFDSQNNDVRTISDGIKEPLGVTLDKHGRLFVANYAANNVPVYANRGAKLVRTISERMTRPDDVRVNTEGTVFVRMKRDVIAYPATGRASYRMWGGPIALDHNDNLYIGRDSTISVYAPGSKKASRKISSDITHVYAMGFDSQNNLYVADWDVPESGLCDSRVEEFAAGTDILLGTISSGVCAPLAFAFDSMNNIYVANSNGNEGVGNSVTVYASGSFTLLRTLTANISEPTDLAIDKSDRLYVASPPINSVAVYQSGAATPSLVLKKGLSFPSHLVVGP